MWTIFSPCLADLPGLCRPEGPIRKGGGVEIYVLHKVKSLLFWKGMKLGFKIAELERKLFPGKSRGYISSGQTKLFLIILLLRKVIQVCGKIQCDLFIYFY